MNELCFLGTTRFGAGCYGNFVKFGFFNILADDEVRQGLKEYADWPTFPQLWVDGELVGGLDIVKEELENDADFFAAYSVKTEGEATA
ncbi:hypothetical protein BN1708_002473 [Verticillium longisporum]|uniref:Glutaredoxin domain-containing protein n=1 Tax=Verticillium longisporum TaxID=100787 RepID=A0A0G4KTU3_VERLO|nr:hypothetical protein BN1708_002473 [Verticillium longisporum]